MNNRRKNYWAWIRTQPEKKQRPLAEGVEFLEVILEKLGCVNIETQMVNLEPLSEKHTPAQHLVCGFDSYSTHILKKISEYVEIICAYQQDHHLVITLSVEKLLAVVHQHFRDFFSRVVNSWGDDVDDGRILGDFGSNFHEDRNEYLISESTYQYLYQNRGFANRGWRLLVEVGLCPREDRDSEMMGDRLIETRRHYIEINFVEMLVDRQVLNSDFLASHRTVFCMADHKRLGEESPAAIFFHHERSDPKHLAPEIFQFLSPPSTPKYPLPRLWKLPDDKKQDMKKIQAQLAILTKEVKATLCVNEERKLKKIKFLQFMLLVQQVNPAFSTKLCLLCVRNEDPVLSKIAMLGSQSHRMRDLVNEIDPSLSLLKLT